MSITCQITQRTASRICLAVPGAAAQPETSQFLAQFVLGLPGVAGVEIWPSSESVVILHHGGRQAGDAILHALRARQLPAGASHLVGGAGTAPDKGESLPYARCEIQHAMRGRVRLHIPVLKMDKGFAGALSYYLSRQPGVTAVRLGRLAATAVIAFDPAATDTQTIVDQVVTYNPQPAEIEQWRTADAGTLDLDERRGRQKIELALALGALVLPVIFGAGAALLVYALLWGSIASMVERSCRFVFKDRRATLDTLAAAAMALLVLNGMAWQAALLPVACAGIIWLRSRMGAQAAQAAPQDEQDKVVIVLPAHAGHTAQAAAAGAPARSAGATASLSSSILGGLAIWVAGRRLRRTAKQAGR